MKFTHYLAGAILVLTISLGILTYFLTQKKEVVQAPNLPSLSDSLSQIQKNNETTAKDPNIAPLTNANYGVQINLGIISPPELTIRAGEMVSFTNIALPLCTFVSSGNQTVEIKLTKMMESPLRYNQPQEVTFFCKEMPNTKGKVIVTQ